MSSIRIGRPSQYMNRFRKYYLYIDGEKVGYVDNGSSLKVDLAPGQHTVHAKIDWCYSNSVIVNLAEGETRSLTVSSFRYAKELLIAGMLFIIPHSIINSRNEERNPVFLLLGLIPLSVFFYYITIGRKKYLKLEEK